MGEQSVLHVNIATTLDGAHCNALLFAWPVRQKPSHISLSWLWCPGLYF